MASTYALLRLGSEFYGHIIKAATSLPPADRAAYFVDAKQTLETVAAGLAEPPANPKSKPPAER